MQWDICLSLWMCGLKKKPECPSKEQLSLHLTSAHGLFALVFIWPSALWLWNREKFCLLEVLACQRTLSLWLCPFIKFTPSAVNSAASRTLAGGMDFQKLNGALALFGTVRLFWSGSKKTTRMGGIFKPRRKWNETWTYWVFFSTPSVCWRWLLYCAYPCFNAMLVK